MLNKLIYFKIQNISINKGVLPILLGREVPKIQNLEFGVTHEFLAQTQMYSNYAHVDINSLAVL